jgi:small-conductance mechanosensitive channel
MEDIHSIFERLYTGLVDILPNIIVSLLVILIGYLLARLIKYLVIRLFTFLEGVNRRKANNVHLKNAGAFLATACFWLIIFSSILIITDLLGLRILTQWFQGILHYIPNIFAAILIILAALTLGNLVSDAIKSFSERTGLKYSSSLTTIVRFLILSLAIIIAMDQIGIEISLLVDIIDIILAALLFGAALAFGLGARTSIGNILAAYYVRKRYNEGDMIQIGKTKGKIVEINAVSIVLENEIGQLTIPASRFNKTKSYKILKD